jgi:hypothetical protein
MLTLFLQTLQHTATSQNENVIKIHKTERRLFMTEQNRKSYHTLDVANYLLFIQVVKNHKKMKLHELFNQLNILRSKFGKNFFIETFKKLPNGLYVENTILNYFREQNAKEQTLKPLGKYQYTKNQIFDAVFIEYDELESQQIIPTKIRKQIEKEIL